MVLLQEAQGAARLIYDDGKRRVDLFNHLPWLCARLAEPGVKARCLELWAAHAPEAHHRVSVSFLSPEGGLRGFVDLIEADGGNIHPELQSSIDSLCACPMDDTAADGAAQHRETHQDSGQRKQLRLARLNSQVGAEHRRR